MHKIQTTKRRSLSILLNILLHLQDVISQSSINVTRVQSTNLSAIAYSPQLANPLNEWVVSPFGKSDQEASTIWHDPRLFFTFHGPTSVACLANLSNFNADMNVTVDNDPKAILFDEMDKSTNEEGLFTFFKTSITNPNDPHRIMLQRSRNPITVTQTWNLVVIEYTSTPAVTSTVPTSSLLSTVKTSALATSTITEMPNPRAPSFSSRTDESNRNVKIIVGVVIGFGVVLLLSAIIFWRCRASRRTIHLGRIRSLIPPSKLLVKDGNPDIIVPYPASKEEDRIRRIDNDAVSHKLEDISDHVKKLKEVVLRMDGERAHHVTGLQGVEAEIQPPGYDEGNADTV